MKEQIADYNPQARRNWFKRKLQGLTNRVAPWVRHLRWEWYLLFHPLKYDAAKVPDSGVPIIINNFNRLALLQQQLEWLRHLDGIGAILIVDNHSDYAPLLNYYASLVREPHIQVVALQHNSWRKGAATLADQLLVKHPYVIITDPDLLPYPSTPPDIVTQLVHLSKQFPQFNHIGLSLEIEDLPAHNPLKSRIYAHESNHWKERMLNSRPATFIAPIDTTFALYHRKSKIEALAPALRTDRPYTLQHIDWYQDLNQPSFEYLHYMQSAKIFATWATELKNNPLLQQHERAV